MWFHMVIIRVKDLGILQSRPAPGLELHAAMIIFFYVGAYTVLNPFIPTVRRPPLLSQDPIDLLILCLSGPRPGKVKLLSDRFRYFSIFFLLYFRVGDWPYCVVPLVPNRQHSDR